MLRHVTVVSLEQAVAAPLATRLLASDGARVIKLERSDGDFARKYDTFAAGSSSYFTWLNFGKESCVVDLRKEKQLVTSLIDKADVVVQNLAPGAVKKLGLDTEVLRSKRKELITVDISGYGSASDRKAYDLLVAAEAGLCSITGSDVGGPGRVGVSIADIMTGRVAYSAVLRALLHRERTGEGAAIAVSLFDVVAEMMTVPLLQYRATGKAPSRMGMKHPSIAPYGAFKSMDGVPIILSCQNEREWVALCEKVLDRPKLATDIRFNSGTERVKNRAALEDIISEIFQKKQSLHLIEKLNTASIAFGRLNEVSDLSQHPFLREQVVFNEFGLEVKLPADPVRILSETNSHQTVPFDTSRSVPTIGENSDTIRRMC